MAAISAMCSPWYLFLFERDRAPPQGGGTQVQGWDLFQRDIEVVAVGVTRLSGTPQPAPVSPFRPGARRDGDVPGGGGGAGGGAAGGLRGAGGQAPAGQRVLQDHAAQGVGGGCVCVCVCVRVCVQQVWAVGKACILFVILCNFGQRPTLCSHSSTQNIVKHGLGKIQREAQDLAHMYTHTHV